MSHYDVNQPQAGYTEIAYGWDVVGADGDKIGTVAAIQPHYISVEKGLLMKKDIFIPTSAITAVADDTVHLNLTKDQIENEDWDLEPEMTGEHRQTAQYNDQPQADDVRRGEADTEGRMHIQLSEEHLDVQKRDVERGRVGIHKEVTEEEQSIDVPLREEEVRIERHEPRTGHMSGDVPDDAFQEQDIEIPIRGEEAEVTKRARVREEVDVSKDVRERSEHVHDKVRREDIHIDHDDRRRREPGERP